MLERQDTMIKHATDNDILQNVENIRKEFYNTEVPVPENLVSKTMAKIDIAMKPLWKRVVFFQFTSPLAHYITAAMLILSLCTLQFGHETIAKPLTNLQMKIIGKQATHKMASLGETILRKMR